MIAFNSIVSFQRLAFACLVVFAFLATPALAQQNCSLTISGHTLDEHDDEPLEFATILVVEAENKSAVSDEHGNYKIEGLCPGTYTLRLEHVGCLPREYTITVAKKSIHKDLFTEHHAELIEGFEIIDRRAEDLPVQTIEKIEGKALDAVSGKNLGTALSEITGVTSFNTGGSISKPVIHGLHSNRVLILNNGVRQEGQQWGSEHGPEIDPFVANRLSVIKGANSVRYGSDAIGGVILVDPAPLRDSIGLDGKLNLVGASNNRMGVVSGILDGKISRKLPLSWRLQGTLKKAGTTKTPNYYLGNTAFTESNFSSTLGYDGKSLGGEIYYSQFYNEIGIFRGSHIGNLTDLQAALEREIPQGISDFTYEIGRPFQKIQHDIFKAKAYWRVGDIGKLTFQYARQFNIRREFDSDRPFNDSIAALNLPELHFELETETADLVWEHNNFHSFTGQFGISSIQQGNLYRGRFFIPNFRSRSFGAFWIERYTTEKWELEAGIRYDIREIEVFRRERIKPYDIFRTDLNFASFSGNSGVKYRPSDHVDLILNVGTAWRPPGINELFSAGLHHGSAAIEFGDESLEQERALNIQATAKYHGHDHFSGEITAYHNIISNFIFLQPTGEPELTIRGAFPVFEYQQADATLTGFDAAFKYQLNEHLSFDGKTSFLWAYNHTADDWLILMPANRLEGELTYAFGTHLNKAAPYLSVNTTHVTEQTRVPEGVDFADPPGAYTLFGIEGGFSLLLGKQEITIGLEVNNLTNLVYRDYLNRFRYFADEAGRNIQLRIKIPFTIYKARN